MSANFLIGLTAGVLGGLAGLGGGVLMIPLLIGIKKLDQHKAHGTSLVALVFTGIIGAATYAMHGTLNIWASLLLAAAAIWPAHLGAKYCCRLPELKLKRLFGLFLIIISILMMSKPHFSSLCHPADSAAVTLILLATGAATGFLSGMMGVGGGSLMIPGMVLLAGFNQYTAQGSSLLAMIPAGTVGAFTHWRQGNVDRSALSGLIPGIITGTFAGSLFAHYLPEMLLILVFTAVLLWTGIRMIKTSRPSCP